MSSAGVISGPGMSKKLRQLAKQIQTERSASVTYMHMNKNRSKQSDRPV